MLRNLLILILALLLQPAPPSVSVAWQGSAAVLSWAGLPVGACVEKAGVVLSDTCTPSGSLTLTGAGRDRAYAPRGGEVYVVRDPAGRGVLAAAQLPMVEVTLPIIARPAPGE